MATILLGRHVQEEVMCVRSGGFGYDETVPLRCQRIFSFDVCCVEVAQQNVSCTDVASRRDLREDVCAIVYTYG